ncbi:hypothetical protein SAMN06295998_13131 [Primorskyibacter flagellatus]|uniref:Uncharacterized protein n=1 Tax=Primorskyibacter flagellatus TaxID=1387277 RepID=A0A1W2EKI4_9RHOB|nr:hypothetical protein SAMN06295998_13131 [Primorskyibacter flagellatus]
MTNMNLYSRGDKMFVILNMVCLTSAPMGQIWRFEQRRVSGSS